MTSRLKAIACTLRERRGLMSTGWLREQQRLAQRIEFHGPAITLPINKIVNESDPWWNRARLRKRA